MLFGTGGKGVFDVLEPAPIATAIWMSPGSRGISEVLSQSAASKQTEQRTRCRLTMLNPPTFFPPSSAGTKPLASVFGWLLLCLIDHEDLERLLMHLAALNPSCDASPKSHSRPLLSTNWGRVRPFAQKVVFNPNCTSRGPPVPLIGLLELGAEVARPNVAGLVILPVPE
jgi:hypothetical protein